ncbi:MAG: SpoIIE family protein phosphatase [Solirubrobacteraceae bacterium]
MLCARFAINEGSQRGEARRIAAARAAGLGFDEEAAGRVSVVVSELAGNLIKHVPGGGELLVRCTQRGEAIAIEVVSIDRGPGLGDRARALRDGFSTAGTSGTGLGAVARLSDWFDLHSSPELGTVIVSRIWLGEPPADPLVTVGAVCATMAGESVPGDACAVTDLNGKTRIMVADGLGHGIDAEAASAKAVEVFRSERRATIAELLEDIHLALRSTRGAAVSIAEIDSVGRALRYVGIGNISATIQTPAGSRSLVTHNGIVGHTIHRIQEFGYELPSGALIVLHSDGIRSRWALDAYPGLARRDPTVIAAILFRDFERGRDDATALVARA